MALMVIDQQRNGERKKEPESMQWRRRALAFYLDGVGSFLVTPTRRSVARILSEIGIGRRLSPNPFIIMQADLSLEIDLHNSRQADEALRPDFRLRKLIE